MVEETVWDGPTEAASEPSSKSFRRGLLIGGLATYAIVTIVLVSFTGVFLARESVFLWLMVGLLVISVADVRGFARGVIVDWLPFYLTLLVYDFLRGFVGKNPLFDPYFLPQIKVDEFLFGGSVPTVTLQERLFDLGRLSWYDVPTWAVYLTHFFMIFIVAALLWRFARPRFLEFRAMVLALSIAAFMTYALVPGAPPWMASDHGLIGPVYRVTGSVWSEIGVQPAAAIWDKGNSLYNPVAALPSLHAAFPALLLCFFWRRGVWVRVLGIGYVLAMGWALVYGGEHYVFDVLLGWIYAVAVYFGVRSVRAKWKAGRTTKEPDDGTALTP